MWRKAFNHTIIVIVERIERVFLLPFLVVTKGPTVFSYVIRAFLRGVCEMGILAVEVKPIVPGGVAVANRPKTHARVAAPPTPVQSIRRRVRLLVAIPAIRSCIEFAAAFILAQPLDALSAIATRKLRATRTDDQGVRAFRGGYISLLATLHLPA